RDSLPPCFSARTAADGSVRVPLGRDGEWLLSCVHMEPSADPAVADWQSQWASLAFARPERRR
ncbi:MAG TPA: hypothetical protein VGU27_00575, partial [Candidatus Eisenbacteria bacterium]|nr:hypothetical protein [Candidatus Eisenbacteria bacterium]